MKKRLLLYGLACFFCVPCGAHYLSDSFYASDHFLTAGEYEGGTLELQPGDWLTVDGGGATWIETVGPSAYPPLVINVFSTSPLSYNGGIRDLMVGFQSSLNYRGGITDLLTVGGDANANLYGGTINNLQVVRGHGDIASVTFHAQENWQWLYTGNAISGIAGLWADGTPFSMSIFSVTGYPPATDSIRVEIVPEPSILALLGLGSVLMRIRNRR